MSLWLDELYLRQISHKLIGFVQKDRHLFNCKCPLCGDSKKKANKKRGYFFKHDKEDLLMFSCKNCGSSNSFEYMLKQLDPMLYREYRLEKFKEEKGGGVESKVQLEEVEDSPVPKKKRPSNILDSLPCIAELDKTNEAYQYAVKRKLPMEDREMFFAENFIEWTLEHTDKFEDWKGKDHPRIVFPFRNREGYVIGYTARSLHGEEPKYYRIFTDEDETEKFYGINLLDEDEQVYVLEGEIDSMYLPNAIAVSNGKLDTYFNKDAIYIADRDVRNPQIMKGVEKLIARGLKVCLLPDDLDGKDIGEFVENGMSQKQILKVIHDNTYQGLKAKLYFNSWRKC